MYEKRTAQSIQKIKSAPYDMVHFTAHKIWYCLAQCPWFKYLVTLIITFISYVFYSTCYITRNSHIILYTYSMDYGLPPGSYNQPVSSFGTGYEEHLVAW